MIYQEKDSACQAYLEKFQNCVDVLDHCGGSIGHVPGLVKSMLEEVGIRYEDATQEELDDANKEIQEQYFVVSFLLSSDRHRYGRLIENLENNYTQGQDRYPKTLTAAYSLLTNWKQYASSVHQTTEYHSPTPMVMTTTNKLMSLVGANQERNGSRIVQTSRATVVAPRVIMPTIHNAPAARSSKKQKLLLSLPPLHLQPPVCVPSTSAKMNTFISNFCTMQSRWTAGVCYSTNPLEPYQRHGSS
jgi:hypothetical protein